MQITAVINKYDTVVEYLHFSDQYTGPRQPELVIYLLSGFHDSRALIVVFNCLMKMELLTYWMAFLEQSSCVSVDFSAQRKTDRYTISNLFQEFTSIILCIHQFISLIVLDIDISVFASSKSVVPIN